MSQLPRPLASTSSATVKPSTVISSILISPRRIGITPTLTLTRSRTTKSASDQSSGLPIRTPLISSVGQSAGINSISPSTTTRRFSASVAAVSIRSRDHDKSSGMAKVVNTKRPNTATAISAPVLIAIQRKTLRCLPVSPGAMTKLLLSDFNWLEPNTYIRLGK